MDHAVRERILTEARGIPLAIQELKSLTSPAVLGTRLGVASWEDDVSSLTEQFLSEISQLSRESRTLLLAAAADPYGETSVFWRAAASLGISADDFVPLETGGYLHVESLVLFPRPALRLAVYRAASDDERRSVHRALAKATESAADLTRHIWHLAHAALRPDEGIAEQLESCLTVARDRGGIAAVAAFLEKATYLTGEPKRRSKRALAAATALNQVSTGAARLLQLVDPASIDSPTRCRLQEQQALMAMAAHRADDAADLLVSAAVQAEPHSADLARQMYLEALTAAIFAGSLGFLQSSVDVSKAAAAGLPPVTSGRADEQLLDALVARHTQGQQASLEPLRIALRNAERFPADGEKWWRWLACLATTEIWDDQAWEAQTAIASRLACETGALTVLARILDNQATANLFFGNFSAASALISQAQRVYAATGTPLPAHAALLLQAWTGQKSAWAFLKDARRQAAEQGEGRTLAVSNLAAAVLLNSSGRYDDALAMLRGCTDEDDLGLSGWMLLELIEAAARARDQESARKALDRLGERTEACDTSWAAGSYASARAMLASGTAADELFREALHHLERTRVGTQLARTQLLYGEWLRRQGSRLDARRQLRAAHQSFTTMGAAAFAVRAQQELFATGEKVRARTSAGDRKLTPQEARIAYLARDGLSNPAIGARMFVSPRTVEYHLHKVFSKLGVTTRGELHLVLPTQATSADA
jgi:DNA-binding CsgD family transcriptional regulator